MPDPSMESFSPNCWLPSGIPRRRHFVRIDERDLEAFIDEGRVVPREYGVTEIGNGRRRRRSSGGK